MTDTHEIIDDESPALANAGRLSLVGLSHKELTYFLQYLSRQRRSCTFDFLAQVLTPEQLMRFLDILAGEVFKVPNREETIKLVEYVQIYTYCKNHLGPGPDIPCEKIPDTIVSDAAIMFNKRKNSVRRIYNKVSGVLQKERLDV